MVRFLIVILGLSLYACGSPENAPTSMPPSIPSKTTVVDTSAAVSVETPMQETVTDFSNFTERDLPVLHVIGVIEINENEAWYLFSDKTKFRANKGLYNVGQELSYKSCNTSSASPSKYHTVKEGETFFSIAKKYGVSVERLKALNPGVTTIYKNTKIRVK